MRKIAMLAIAAVGTIFGIVAVAHAANTYTVTVASVSPTKAGTTSNPKHTTINFGYQVGETSPNTRPSTTTDYVIGFGRNIINGRKFFKGNKTCTVAQAGYVSGAAPNCPAGARAGSGSVQNQAGIATDKSSIIPCFLALTVYVGDGKSVPASANDGIAVKNDLVLALKGGSNPDPAKNCPLTVDAAIPAGFRTVAGGTALAFHVKRIPFQQPTAGVENSVVNVTSSVGKSIRVRIRRRVGGRLRTVTVTRGLFMSKGCTGRRHVVNVQFKDASGASNSASKNAACRP